MVVPTMLATTIRLRGTQGPSADTDVPRVVFDMNLLLLFQILFLRVE
jgi:hypothetical protein